MLFEVDVSEISRREVRYLIDASSYDEAVTMAEAGETVSKILLKEHGVFLRYRETDPIIREKEWEHKQKTGTTSEHRK